MGDVRPIALDELALERRPGDGCWVRVGTTAADREADGWTNEQRLEHAGMAAPVYANEKKASEVKDQLVNLRRAALRVVQEDTQGSTGEQVRPGRAPAIPGSHPVETEPAPVEHHPEPLSLFGGDA
jgi:hypothetical protein